MKNKIKLLIIGSSQGVYGGIEAFMVAIADAAKDWPEFEVRICFKLINKEIPHTNLVKMSEQVCSSVHFVSKSSIELFKLVSWADVLHVQNMPPDIVFPAYLLQKKTYLTIHNRKQDNMSFHTLIWSISKQFARKRWFNSKFVWNSWEAKKKKKNSDSIPTICKFPTISVPVNERKGFIFVGRWIENKGIEELLKAYSACKLNEKNWPLTILGDGPLKFKIVELIKQLNLKNVILPGFVDDAEKMQLIASSKWLLAPAKTLEDLGLTPIEARCSGVPSIVTNDGGLPEAGGSAALIAIPGDINSLKECMIEAVNMTDNEYSKRAILSKESLSSFLKPIEFYRQQFLK